MVLNSANRTPIFSSIQKSIRWIDVKIKKVEFYLKQEKKMLYIVFFKYMSTFFIST